MSLKVIRNEISAVQQELLLKLEIKSIAMLEYTFKHVKASTAPNRIRCPEMKFALNHRSRFLHGHDCCETGKAFPQVRQEKYFRPDARTAQAAVVRALPRFASDFHPESDPAASSKTSRTGTLTLSQRSKLHLPHTLTVRSDSEALLQRFVFAQRQNRYFPGQHRIRCN